MQLKQAIQQQAQSLGFALVGVTTPDPPPHYAAYETWLCAGRQAGMGYLASPQVRAKRADPRLILPECRSILVLAMPYFPQTHPEVPAGAGLVASYAWGEDYHLVLPDRLGKLVSFIEAQIGYPIASCCYTDTGPLLERDLAQRAGLGWIGKNTCLINPRLGSYFFLSEILLDIELEPDPPFTMDHCGTCSRCIDACPTSCILPDRSLDAGRCISYLTIELKEQIPPDLRAQLGSWVFGCDRCQQVCPWNRFALAQGEPAFAPRPGLPVPDLQQELGLSPAQFSLKYKRSPVQRAKRRGYLRNVAVALGNHGALTAVPVLRHVLLHEPEALVRQAAAWALGQIGGVESRRALDLAWESETDPQVLAEIQTVLRVP